MKSGYKVMFIAVAALSATVFAQQGSIILQARLSGIGKGKVVWKTKDRGQKMQAELGAEGERLPANTTYEVHIGNVFADEVTTSALGTWSIQNRFIGPNRPAIANGDLVEVIDADGNVVQAGVLAPK